MATLTEIVLSMRGQIEALTASRATPPPSNTRPHGKNLVIGEATPPMQHSSTLDEWKNQREGHVSEEEEEPIDDRYIFNPVPSSMSFVDKQNRKARHEHQQRREEHFEAQAHTSHQMVPPQPRSHNPTSQERSHHSRLQHNTPPPQQQHQMYPHPGGPRHGSQPQQ